MAGQLLMAYADVGGNRKLKNISFIDLEISDFGMTGMDLGSWNYNTGYQNLLIKNVLIHDVRENGIVSYAFYNPKNTGWAHRNIRVINTVVHDVTGYAAKTHRGNGILLGDVDSGLIEGCTAYNNGTKNTACGGPGGIWAYESNSITIQFCESYANKCGTGCDGLGFDLDGGVTNSFLQYNYSHDNAGAGYLLGQYDDARPWANNTVRYNISENDGRRNGGGITLFKGYKTTMKGAMIYNNTVYISKADTNKFIGAFSMFDIDTGINGTVVYNNIFQTKDDVPLVNVPKRYQAKLNQNLYWSSGDSFKIKYQGKDYHTLTDWQTATRNEMFDTLPTGLVADPKLLNAGGGKTMYPDTLTKLTNYKLAPTSPAINAGFDLRVMYGIKTGNRDFWGDSLYLDTAVDIGAYESHIITAVNAAVNQFQYRVFPNPTPQGMELKIMYNALKLSAEIYTVQGVMVMKQISSGGSFMVIATQSLPKGIYFLRLMDEKGFAKVEKIMVE
ncbi:MAG: T9SS type A sorting domain-containing protein [Bacteroidetes bacterium]|nr:T9SS type A sorting domain-containing protein [Bacteroidota bacterium]